ncbi:hypothetical protein IJ21_43760 [Paenibacillus sp. 32O-W]|nr:hypothetical protein IJ21_43760 [Paenibacillus sp. 32O-W]
MVLNDLGTVPSFFVLEKPLFREMGGMSRHR